MDERAEVRALLQRAVDAMGEVAAPSVDGLVARNRRSTRLARGIAVATAVIVVAGVAVGVVSVTGTRRGDSIKPPAVSFTSPSPSSTVSARALMAYRWRALPVAPIPVRDDPTAVWTGRQLFVWGGEVGNTARADGALYDPAARRWTQLPPSPLSARSGALSTVVDHQVILWGGYGGTSDGARFNLNTGAWSRLPAPPSGASETTGTAQLITFGTSAVLLRAARTMTSRTIRVDRYDPHTNQWTSLPTLLTAPGHGIASLVALSFGHGLYVWAGWAHSVQQGAGTETNVGVDAYRLSASSTSWATSSVRPAAGFAATGAQGAGDRVLFPQTGSDCDVCTGPFVTVLEPLLVNPRTGATATVPNGPLGHAGDQIFWTGNAVLGYDSHTAIGSSITPGAAAVWDATTNGWTGLPRAPTRKDVFENVVVWTGSALLIWGMATERGTRVATGGFEFAGP